MLRPAEVLQLFRRGMNTVEIAALISSRTGSAVHEAEVVNALHRARLVDSDVTDDKRWRWLLARKAGFTGTERPLK